MKTIPLLLFGLLLSTTAMSNENVGHTGEKNSASTTSTISIGCTHDLCVLTKSWASGFNQTSQNTNISVFDDGSAQSVNLQFCSAGLLSSVEKAAWKMVVARETVVPIMNSQNPMADIFFTKGVSAENWNKIATGNFSGNWSNIIGKGPDTPAHFYVIDDQNIRSAIANFLKTDAGSIQGTVVANISELMSVIQADKNAIGFCKLPDILNVSGNELPAGISLVPIDKNGNGRLDRFENIYSDPVSFMQGTWVGKYPKALCRNIYAVAEEKPTDKSQLAFLTWIMNDGQKLLNTNGYTILASTESRDNVNNLTGVETVTLQPEEKKSDLALVLIIAGVIIAGILSSIVIRSIKAGRIDHDSEEVVITDALNESSIEAPAGLYYDKSHTWAFMEKDGKVRMGIDDFMPHLTGRLSKIIMKEPGETIRKGEKILTLSKDGKQISIHAPVSGTITDQNSALVNNPGILSSSPYNYGWVYLIEPKNWLREIEFMFMKDKYKVWLKDEFSRLRDFLSSSIKTNSSAYTHIVLQDGGELTSNVLADLEPEVWEDFQTKFIDISK